MGIRVLVAFVGVVGLLLLAFAGRFVAHNLRLLRRGVRTEGKVAGAFSRSIGRGRHHFVRVDFIAKDGVEHRSECQVHQRYPVGAHVTLSYLSEDPSTILVHSWFGNWWLPALLTVFGLFLGYLGFAQFFVG